MKLSLSFIVFFLFVQINAQEIENPDIEKTVEASYLAADDGIDYSEFETNQNSLKKFNLNKLSTIDLHSMNVLSFGEIEHIIEHQKIYGPIKSKYELQTIDGLDSSIIANLLELFDISDFTIQSLLKQKHHELFRLKHSYRLEKSLGYKLNDSNKFMGNRSKIGILYNSESTNLNYGLHVEKDAGETEKMLFQSAYLLIKPNNKIKSLFIGDQQINIAQGLSLGTGIGTGKTASVMQIMRNNEGSKAYKSFNETGFLRGLSIKSQITPKVESLFFTGIRPLDAKPINDSNGTSFGSIINSGYYRNIEEQKSRHQLYQLLNGFHTLVKYPNFEIGTMAIHQVLKTKIPQSDNISYTTMGNKLRDGLTLELDWKFHLKNNLVFGEYAESIYRGRAFICGVLRTLGKKTDLSLLCRFYNKNEEIKLSNRFGNNSNNENGFYIGICTQLPAKMTMNFYNDVSLYQRPKYRVDANSYQTEQMLEIAYKTKQAFSFYIRYKRTEHEENKDLQENIHSIVQHQKTNFRLHSEVKFEKIKLRNRVEFIQYKIKDGGVSFGGLIYQDFIFNYKSKMNVTLRYCSFSSDDFNSRTFAYENDVPGTFSLPTYIGKGSRSYILIRYQIQKDLQIWIRFARSLYSGVKSTGTGLNQIESPHNSDLTFQIQWKL